MLYMWAFTVTIFRERDITLSLQVDKKIALIKSMNQHSNWIKEFEFADYNTKDTVHWPSLDETLSKCIFVQNAPHMRKLEKSAC